MPQVPEDDPDLTDIIDLVAEELWNDSHAPDGPPWSELDDISRYHVKAQLLPVVYETIKAYHMLKNKAVEGELKGPQ